MNKKIILKGQNHHMLIPETQVLLINYRIADLNRRGKQLLKDINRTEAYNPNGLYYGVRITWLSACLNIFVYHFLTYQDKDIPRF